MLTRQTKVDTPAKRPVALNTHAGSTTGITQAAAWTEAWGSNPPTGLFDPARYLSAPLQTKLAIGQPYDPYEREAEQVAEQVMRMPEPTSSSLSPAPGTETLQRKCACGGDAGPGGECEECKAKRLGLQRKATAGASGGISAPPIVHQVLQSPGQPLDKATRDFMEPRFGQDFSEVQVHTGQTAARSARAINARAYTVGQSIVFGAGQYMPDSNAGRALLAHELTHVVQQAGTVSRTAQRSASEESAEASYDIDETIATLAVALSVAESTLADPELPSERRDRIARQVEKLAPLLGQLEQARGTDGEGVEYGFDPTPSENEIEPGDSEKNLDQLYAGFSPPPGRGGSLPQTGTQETGGEEGVAQAAPLPGGLQITPLTTPGIQRCEAICIGIIVLSGLLLAGCNRDSAPAQANRTTPCTPDETQAIRTRHTTGLNWVNDALSKLAAYQNGSATPEARAVVANALQANFHTTDAAHVTRIASQLGAIQTAMSGQAYAYKCECSGSADAYTLGTGNTAQVHFCPRWFASTDEIRRVTTLVHEVGHSTGLGGSVPITSGRVEDIYEFHDGYRTMTPAQAMSNPDPHAVFARQLFHNGGHPPGSHR